MKKVFASLLIFTVLLSLASCGTPAEKAVSENTPVATTSTEATPARSTTEKKVIKIGVSNCSDTDTFTKNVADELQKLIEKNQPDWEVTFVGAELDPSVQLSQIETFISSGVDYIVMSASDTEGNVPCVEAANAAGIPLIDFVNPIAAPDEDFIYVGGSNVACGEQLAAYASKNLSKNTNVVIMEGQPGHANGEDRVNGIKAGLAKNRSDVTILASQTANWQREDGMSLMEDWIEAYGDKINAVLCVNDQMALGAVEAIKAHNMKDIMVVGVDGTWDALEYIKEGSMTMTLFYNHVKQATNTYNVLLDLIESGDITHENVISEFEEINQDNVQTFIDKYYSNK